MNKLLTIGLLGVCFIAQAQQFTPVLTDSLPDVTANPQVVDLNRNSYPEIIFWSDNQLIRFEEGNGYDTLGAESIDSWFGILDFDGDNIQEVITFAEINGQRGVFSWKQSSEPVLVDEFDSLTHLKVHARTTALLTVSGWKDNVPLNNVYSYKQGWESISLSTGDAPANDMLPLRNLDTTQIITLEGTSLYLKSLYDSPDSLLSEYVQHINRALASDGIEGLLISFTTVGDGLTKVFGDSTLDLSPRIKDQILESIIADFTNDGWDDLLYTDEESQLRMLTHLYQSDSSELIDLGRKLTQIQPADWDNDGDLDVIGISPEEPELIILQNTDTTKNFGPMIVTQHVAFSIKDKIVIGWDKTYDDHTPANKITYDVAIGSGEFTTDVLANTFHLDSASRMQWNWGNTGNATSIEIKANAGSYWYAIQSVDNARVTLIDWENCPYPIGGENLCRNLPIACGVAEACETASFTEIPVCNDNPLRMRESYAAGWYSSRLGFMGITATLIYSPMAGDTLYSVPLNDAQCGNQKAYIFTDAPLPGNFGIAACSDEEIELAPVAISDSTLWFRDNLKVAVAPQFTFVPNDSLEIIIAQSYFSGCVKVDSFRVELNDPAITVSPESATVLFGETITIEAQGGVTYRWTPQEIIDQNLGISIVILPTEDVTVEVTGTNEAGCSGKAEALIEVTAQAFIPNLFTPNDDASNDVLLIYGLTTTSSFDFVIYDRNGSVVFRCEDADQMETSGWDGTDNGRDVPDGTYYWKVDGEFADGSDILLNGSQEGVLHLMR